MEEESTSSLKDGDENEKRIDPDEQKLLIQFLNSRTPIRVFFRQKVYPPIPPKEKYLVPIPQNVSTEDPVKLNYDELPLYGIIHTWSIFTDPDTDASGKPKQNLFPFIEFPPRESFEVERPQIQIAPSSVSKLMYYYYNCLRSTDRFQQVKHICTSGFKNLYIETYPNCPPNERTLFIEIIPAQVTNLTQLMSPKAIEKIKQWVPDPTLYQYRLKLDELQALSPDEKPRRRPTRRRPKRYHGHVFSGLVSVETSILPLQTKQSDTDAIVSDLSHLALVEANKTVLQCCHPEHAINDSWCIRQQAFVCNETGAAICVTHMDNFVASMNDILTDAGFPKNRWFPICPVYYLCENRRKSRININATENDEINPVFHQVGNHSSHRINVPLSVLISKEYVNQGFVWIPHDIIHPCEFFLSECTDCLLPSRCSSLVNLQQNCSIANIMGMHVFKCTLCSKTKCIRCKRLASVCQCWTDRTHLLSHITTEQTERNNFISSLCVSILDESVDEIVCQFVELFADPQPRGHIRRLAMFTTRMMQFITILSQKCKKQKCLCCKQVQSHIISLSEVAVICSENHILCNKCGEIFNKDICEGEFCPSLSPFHQCLAALPIVQHFAQSLISTSVAISLFQSNLTDACRFLSVLSRMIIRLVRSKSASSPFDKHLVIWALERHPWWLHQLTEFASQMWDMISISVQRAKNDLN